MKRSMTFRVGVAFLACFSSLTAFADLTGLWRMSHGLCTGQTFTRIDGFQPDILELNLGRRESYLDIVLNRGNEPACSVRIPAAVSVRKKMNPPILTLITFGDFAFVPKGCFSDAPAKDLSQADLQKFKENLKLFYDMLRAKSNLEVVYFFYPEKRRFTLKSNSDSLYCPEGGSILQFTN